MDTQANTNDQVVQPIAVNQSSPKWPWILGGLVLLVLVGTGGVFLGKQMSTSTTTSPTVITPTQPSDLTGNWPLYVNNKYGISIKYPEDWDYLEVPNGTYLVGNNQVWFSPKVEGWPPPSTSAMPAIVISMSNTDFLKNWTPNFFDNYKTEPYKVGNVTGQKISGTNKESSYEESVILIQAGSLYLQISNNGGEASKLYFDQILSTFKFIAPVDTTGWKAYEFKEANLQFQLPASFGNLQEELVSGEAGTQVCFTKVQARSWFVETVYAGGGCNNNFQEAIRIGTTSVDYTAGREGSFTDLQGFVFQDRIYQVKFVSGRLADLPQELVSKVTNSNGIEVLKVIGNPVPDDGPTLMNSIGTGYIGLVLNTKSSVYPGFTFVIKLADGVTMSTVDQIIASLKFI